MDYRMYILVNKNIEMSSAKLGTQTAHVTTNYLMKYADTESERFQDWYADGLKQTKIILNASQGMLTNLEDDYASVRDNGKTELESGTLTCVCLGILTKKEFEVMGNKYKRLQLRKD